LDGGEVIALENNNRLVEYAKFEMEIRHCPEGVPHRALHRIQPPAFDDIMGKSGGGCKKIPHLTRAKLLCRIPQSR
jgi:hypothetical protein